MAETQLLDYGFALDDGAGLQLTGYGFYYSAAGGAPVLLLSSSGCAL